MGEKGLQSSSSDLLRIIYSYNYTYVCMENVCNDGTIYNIQYVHSSRSMVYIANSSLTIRTILTTANHDGNIEGHNRDASMYYK